MVEGEDKTDKAYRTCNSGGISGNTARFLRLVPFDLKICWQRSGHHWSRPADALMSGKCMTPWCPG